jgi:ribosomal protein L7Ae-like RNA K-turn-binding protein
MRTCAGCGERVDIGSGGAETAQTNPSGSPRPSLLVRLVLGPGGEICVDGGDGAFGRGMHVHACAGCLKKAVQRGIARTTKGRGRSVVLPGAATPVPLTVASLAAAIRQAMDRRIQGLLVAAARSRQVAIGTEAVKGACKRAEAKLIVVATDAAASADLSEVRRAISEGWAVAWGTKQGLSTLCRGDTALGSAGLAILAIKSDRIAARLRDAVHAAEQTGQLEKTGTEHGDAAADPLEGRRVELSTVERGA